ncbi:muramoyltetrapeptide carboxypeptidase [Terribacillus aidingensis]|uniref:Muramoyltetrapeptide carboxypeptidase n=1 Tax=Terribacillus aidingensis TaxID=586416 RepID=A0A285N6P8_9BACI|nr:LD-carboxypeptidase [Terribacillus aidingensis]SNZ04537.1 muramoyltetrapeptide carboxypeptidase [Terribacillus aidingensis]
MKPSAWKKGNTIGIVAPAGPVKQEELLRGLEIVESLGVTVKLGKHVYDKYGYLAGSDADRAADLNRMFQDDEVKGIICARGGYGSGRIADLVDYQLIKQKPKVLLGYSDITYLHTSIRQRTGLVTFHGPMVASDMGESDFAKLSYDLLQQFFTPTDVVYTSAISPLEAIVHGKAAGPLVGGNLSLLISTLGTPDEIDTAGKLLLLEDIEEPPYRVDSMLNQLKQAGKLDSANGIIIGDFRTSIPEDPENLLSYDQVFVDYLTELQKPVMKGFRIGHCNPNITVPLGTEATMDTEAKVLRVKAGVSA